MSRERALAALEGHPVRALGLTWVAPAAVRGLTFGRGIENDPEGLAAIAVAFGVDLAFVEGSAGWAAEAVHLLREADVAVAWAASGVFSRVAATHGWSEAIAASAREPGALAYALDVALHELLVEVRSAQECGADVLVVADELASTAGWLISPDFALEALLPSYAAAVGEWADRPAIFHSDGDVRALYHPLKRVGFAGVHLALHDSEHLGLAANAALSAGLCPVGGIRTVGLRSDGARRSAEQAVAMALKGPFVIADDGGMTAAEEVAAFGAALDAIRSNDSGADQ